MKKILTIASALAALFMFASCAEDSLEEAKDVNASTKTVSVTATLPSAGQGMKSSFSATDFLRVRFAMSDGTQVGRTQVLKAENPTGTSATFTGKVAVPNEAAKMLVYVENNAGKINYASAPTKDNLTGTDGSLAAAVAQQVIMGSTDVNNLSANVSLEYKTAVVKLVITYPEDVKVAVGDQVALNSDNLYNQVILTTDSPAEGSAKGVLSAKVASVSGQTATCYIPVWADGNGIKNGDVYSEISTITYGKALDNINVKAGSLTEIKATLETRVFNYYINDDEKTYDGLTGNKVSGPDWIVKSGSKVTVQANNTGSSRTGTIVFDNGTKITVTQVGIEDFKGSWSYIAKAFSNNTSVLTKGDNKAVKVTFGEPLKAETLTDCNGVTHTSNIGITGLYDTAVMDASLEIDYSARTANFAILLDARTAQKVSKSNINGYSYVCFLPEMGTGSGNSWSSPWNFVQADIDSAKDYVWLEFTANDEINEFSWNSFTQGQYVKGDLATSANRIIGITCAVSKSAEASKANVYATYNVIYQANTNSDAVVPTKFKKN